MKKCIVLLVAALLLAPLAVAEDFTLEERRILQGMDQSWQQGYEPTVEGGYVNICLPLTSEQTGGKITATLVLNDESVSPFSTGRLSAECWKNEGLYAVRMRLPLVSARHSGDYAARVVVEGQNRDGGALRAEYPVVIRIRDGRADAIRPGLSAVAADLTLGEKGCVSAVLTNTSPYAEMQDIELVVSDATGDVLPDGSDRLALGSLMPGESTRIEYPVTVKPNAAVEMHALSFELSYTALDQPNTWAERFTLPVTQEIRLEQGGLQTPGSVIQGDTATFTLPLMNMGRGELTNVMATLSMPGVVERQSVLVGTLSAGETKQARLTVMPGRDVLGEVKGSVTVTGEDAWGNSVRLALPASLTVEEAPVMKSVETPEDMVKEMVPAYAWILAGACLLLLAALIVQGVALGGKIRHLEEDKL